MTYFNTSNTEYIAGGCIHYRFNRTTGCEGSLYVQKLHNNKPISFSGGLLGRWSRETPLKLTTLKINNVTFNDILFFDENNTEQITNHNQVNPIKVMLGAKNTDLYNIHSKTGRAFHGFQNDKFLA